MVVVKVKVQIGGRDGATARRRGSLLDGRATSVGVAARSHGLLIPPSGQRRQFTPCRCLLLMRAYQFPAHSLLNSPMHPSSYSPSMQGSALLCPTHYRHHPHLID